MSESAITISEIKPRTSLRYIFSISLILAVCLFAFYAHVRIAQAGDEYTGILAPLDRLFDTALAVALVTVSFCVGRGINRKLGLEFVSVAEEVSFSAMLGVGAIACGLLGLGLAGALEPLPVAALFLLLITIFHREAARLRGVIGERFRAINQTRTQRIVSLMFILLVAILVLRTASPPHAYDEAIYHLAATKLFVDRGEIYPLYDSWQGDMPFLIHMIYAVCLMLKSDIAAKMFSLGLAGISSLALYGFCARFLNRRTGIIAMFGFFGAGMVVEVAVTSRIDVSMSAILFLAVYAMMVHLETKKLPWLWVSAALAGFGLSIKYTAAGWLALLLLMFLFETLVRRRDALRVITRQLVVYLFIAGTIASPWYLKNLVWFHNPVYPYVTGEAAELNPRSVRYFGDEDELSLAKHFDEAREAIPEVVEEQDRKLTYATSLRSQRRPFRFWLYFTAPETFNMAEPYHDPNYLFLFAPFFLFFSRCKWMVWLAIFGAAFFLFTAAASQSSGVAIVGRYLLPIYPGLTILAAYTMNEVAVRFRSRSKLVVALPAIAIGIAVSGVVIVCVSRIQAMDALSYARGAISHRQFMRGLFYYPPLDFINRNLEPDARVMMIGAQMCYDMKRHYVLDGSLDSTGWRRLLVRNATLDRVNQDLKRQGVTHILYAPGHFTFSAMIDREGQSDRRPDSPNPGYLTQLRNWATFEHYKLNFLDPIYEDERGYQIYAIK